MKGDEVMNDLGKGTGRSRPSGESCFRMTRSCTLWLLCLFVSLTSVRAAEPPIIFLVRHAERAATSGRVPSDTGLSPAGVKRAESLAKALRDAGITAIYTSEYRRTKETAGPLAKSLGVTAEVIPAGDQRLLLQRLKASRGNALVIGHSNTLPEIIHVLGVRSPIQITEADYDNLFLVVLEAEPRLLRLHYR